ncbi:hypothetical protein ACFFMN_22360 [Planobispora siamensis]|uniref:Uncharacterized protein n=1 Tax=Planobispora siamensis TaxID=936338 RepID=A0A8J3SH23_9ACTN|nr:hypothetical protein [Planobispora siamensis]GIH94178.1 hypothetical protein Psi01_48080 [Planobispora siamensis]
MTARGGVPPSSPPLDGRDVPGERPDRDGAPAAARGWASHLWWISLLAGVAGFAFVWLVMPHGREAETVWEFAAKLLAFALLCCAVAFFPWVSWRQHWLLYVPFVFFTGYVIPRISYFYYGDVGRVQDDSFYTHLYLLLYPGIVLTAAAAYRVGGGPPGRCLKIAFSGIVIVFSGLLDIMWQLVNPVEIPATIDAPHITVFTGGPISFGATILFALAHIPIVIVINLLPLDRWIGRLPGAERLTADRAR